MNDLDQARPNYHRNEWAACGSASSPAASSAAAFGTTADLEKLGAAVLKTTDLEEAKRLVAEIVASHRTNDPRDPESVPLVYVLTYYLENHADKLPSADVARRASNLVLRFLEEKCGFGAEVQDRAVQQILSSRVCQMAGPRVSAFSVLHQP
jgi:hypothetical protein